MPHGDLSRPFELLLVEEYPEDLRKTEEVLTQVDLPLHLQVAQQGETLDLPHWEERFRSGPRPDLIMIDLNLISHDPIDILAALKQDTELKRIPVAMLGPQSEDAIDISFEHDADLYVAKPLDAQRLVMTVNWAQGL